VQFSRLAGLKQGNGNWFAIGLGMTTREQRRREAWIIAIMIEVMVGAAAIGGLMMIQ
jgi:hypothetical protein